MSRKLLLYPERQRCRACRRYWSLSVPLRGMYCSPECAGRPSIPTSEFNGVQIPPRTCRQRLKINGPNTVPQVVWKAVFASEADAMKVAKKSDSAYECPNCWYWHLTSISPERWAELQDLRNKQVM